MLNDEEKPSPCNCRDKPLFQWNGSCQHKHLVYSCKVSTPDLKQNHQRPYIGLTEQTFKDIIYKHNNSFEYESKRNSTWFSNFIWGKSKEKINVDPDWSILVKTNPSSPASKKFILCLTGKNHIISSTKNLLNKRNELVTCQCRHENKFYFPNCKDMPSYLLI